MTTYADTDEAVLAVSDFNSALGTFGYEAELDTDRHGNRVAVVRWHGEVLDEFPEAGVDWLEDLASYAYRIENGAMAA